MPLRIVLLFERLTPFVLLAEEFLFIVDDLLTPLTFLLLEDALLFTVDLCVDVFLFLLAVDERLFKLLFLEVFEA